MNRNFKLYKQARKMRRKVASYIYTWKLTSPDSYRELIIKKKEGFSFRKGSLSIVVFKGHER